MRIVSAVLAGATLALAGRAAGQTCALSTLDACANTNQLVWSQSFKPALTSFAGTRAVQWLGETATLADVVSEVLAGPPDDVVRLDGGLLRFSAARPQSTTERGAVIIDNTGSIKAAGVLHFNCAQTCDKTYTLSVILREHDSRMAEYVKAWADLQMTLNADGGLDRTLTTVGRAEVIITAP